jgi:Holliday junction DNA helicase RuvA
MIAYLTGVVHRIDPKKIIILTPSGVGYEVIPTGSLLATCQVDQPKVLEIFTVVREQELTLYGFDSSAEKKLFEQLISVSGIGPKTAVGMVSTPVDKLRDAIEQGDITYITRMPGIGKKTAQRLVVELKGKIDLSAAAQVVLSSAKVEASEGLANLGYDRRDIEGFMKAADDGLSTEELVKGFLVNG